MLDYTLHWFFLSGQGLHCLTSCFTGSFLRGIVCIFSLPSLVHLYWAWFVLFHRTLHWFFLLVMVYICSLPSLVHHYWACLYCLTSCFTGSSFLGMVCIVSLHASLVHHHWAWFVLLDYELHWFFLTWYCVYFFTSCVIDSSLLSMVWVVSRHASLVHPYWAWFVLFHFMVYCFLLNGIVGLFHCMLDWFILI